MREMLLSVTRALSTRRVVGLFKDQEDLIEELSKKLGIKINVTSLVRTGVDLALRDLQLALVKEEDSNAKKISKEG